MERPRIEVGTRAFWQRREDEVVELTFCGWAKDCPGLEKPIAIGSLQNADGPVFTCRYDPDGAAGTFRFPKEVPKPEPPPELKVEEPKIKPVSDEGKGSKLEKLEEVLPEPKKSTKKHNK